MIELSQSEILTLKKLASEYKRNPAVIQPNNNLNQHQSVPPSVQLGRILYQDTPSIAKAFGAVKGYHTSGMEGYNANWLASRYMYKCRWQPFKYDENYLRAGLVHGPTHARVLHQQTGSGATYLEGYVFGDAFMQYGDDSSYMQSVVMAIKCSIGWLLLPLPDVTASWRACYQHAGSTATIDTSYTQLTTWTSEHYQSINNGEKNGFAFGYEWGTAFDDVPINVGGLYDFELTCDVLPGSSGWVELVLSVQLDGEAASATGSVAGPRRLLRVASGDLQSTVSGCATVFIPQNLSLIHI